MLISMLFDIILILISSRCMHVPIRFHYSPETIVFPYIEINSIYSILKCIVFLIWDDHSSMPGFILEVYK